MSAFRIKRGVTGGTCKDANSSRFSAAQRPRGRWGHARKPAMPVIGFLDGQSFDLHPMTAFRQALKDAGYIEGRNVAIYFRSADEISSRFLAAFRRHASHEVLQSLSREISSLRWFVRLI
jgi:hypothetical protein